MTPEAIKKREYRARRKAQGKTRTDTGDAARIKELEAALKAAEQRAAAAEQQKTVSWSARIPAALRERVRAVQGNQSIQDITAAALELWCDQQEQGRTN